MADNKVVISIEAQNADKAKQALKEIGVSAKDLGNQLRESSVGTQIMSEAWKTFGSIVSVAAVATFFKETIRAAMEQEDALNRLTGAMEIQGTATQELITLYQNLAKSLQETTRYSDEAIMQTMQQMVSLGKIGPENMERATRAALDLSAATGRDLTSATLAIAKAAAGSTSGLARYGIVIDENISKGEKFNKTLEYVEKHFGGMAQRDVNTFSGAVAKLGNSWGEVMEELGKFVTENPAVIEGLHGMIDNTNSLSKAIADFRVGTMLAQVEDLKNEIMNMAAPEGALLQFRNAIYDMFGDKRQDNIKAFQQQLTDLVIQLERMGVDIADQSTLNLLNEEEINRVMEALETIRIKRGEIEQEAAITHGATINAMLDQERVSLETLQNLWSGYNTQKTADQLASNQVQTEKYNFLIDTQKKANTSLWNEAGKMRDAFSKGMSQLTFDTIKGNADVKKTFEDLGDQMLKILTDWAVQTTLNWALSKVFHAAEVATATTTGASVAAAWAPAAAMVSLASFGGNAGPAITGMTATTFAAHLLAVPKAEEGGIIRGSPGGTLLIAGEKNKDEAIIPLDRASDIGMGKGDTYVSIEINYPVITNNQIAHELVQRIADEVSYIINKESER